MEGPGPQYTPHWYADGLFLDYEAKLVTPSARNPINAYGSNSRLPIQSKLRAKRGLLPNLDAPTYS